MSRNSGHMRPVNDYRNVSNTIMQLYGMITTSAIIFGSMLISESFSSVVGTLSLIGYFCTLVIGLATHILFLAAYEHGPFAGNYAKTIALEYNSATRLTAVLWLISSIGLGAFLCTNISNNTVFYMSTVFIVISEIYVFWMVIKYYKRKIDRHNV